MNIIAIRPVGEHLGTLLAANKDRTDRLVAQILAVFKDVAIVLREAFEKAKLVHCDLSFSNIMHIKGRGLLIDWDACCDAGQVANLSYTLNFSSGRLLRAVILNQNEYSYKMHDAVESLFYVMYYVLSDAAVWWKHHNGNVRYAHSMKFTWLHDKTIFSSQLEKHVMQEGRDLLDDLRTNLILQVADSNALKEAEVIEKFIAIIDKHLEPQLIGDKMQQIKI